MEIEADRLFQLIGRQHVQILELERQLEEVQALAPEPVTELHPISEDAQNAIRAVMGDG